MGAIGNLSEIMESLQGEGIMAGSRQVFLRFTGCNLCCNYCDTPDSLTPIPLCRVYTKTGERSTGLDIANPVRPEQIAEIIQEYYSSHWISLTGGEPLLWPSFIKELAVVMKARGYRFLLETNGTLSQALETCLPWIDCISMDWKLPSAVGQDTADMHQAFLQLAYQKSCYIKLVITANSRVEEVKRAVELIAQVGRHLSVILQIASPVPNVGPPSLEMVLEMQRQAMLQLDDVRVLPQIHRLMNLI